MENIINEFINSDVIIIFLAFLNNILTALIKLPIKKLSTNKKITRFITFLPIVIGLAIALLYVYLKNKQIVFNEELLNMWFNNSSFSLALYAFEEKFLFNSEAKDYEKEINDNQELLNEIKKIVVKRNNIDEEKIILRGKKHE